MDLAHIARLKEQQELAYNDTQAQITQWKKFGNDYTVLQDRLKTLPDKVTHDVMVPFGSLAFMPGQIIHSNEIMVLLGDNWFAERSAKQACEIVDRRKKQIYSTLKELEEQKRLLGDRLGFTSEFKNLSENKEGVVDIREEYDPEQERLWREERKRKKHHNASKTKPMDRPPEAKHSSKADISSKKSTSPKVATSTKPKDGKSNDTPVKVHQKTNDTSRKGQASDTQRSSQSAKVAQNESKDQNVVEGKTNMPSEEERLFARLEELERQEEEMDELARLSDYEADEEQENQPMFSFVQEDALEEPSQRQMPQKQLDGTECPEKRVQEAAPEGSSQRRRPPNQLERTDSSEKRVQWKDQQDSRSSHSSGSDDEDVVISTIHFTHSKMDKQPEIKPSTTNELTSPADIYKQYVAMQPFLEDTHQQQKLSTSATLPSTSSSSSAAAAVAASMSSAVQSAESAPLKSIMKPARSPEPVKKKPPKEILPQLDSVFSGNVVERVNVTVPTQADNEPMPTDKPTKRVSKFKAARQQKR